MCVLTSLGNKTHLNFTLKCVNTRINIKGGYKINTNQIILRYYNKYYVHISY